MSSTSSPRSSIRSSCLDSLCPAHCHCRPPSPFLLPPQSYFSRQSRRQNHPWREYLSHLISKQNRPQSHHGKIISGSKISIRKVIKSNLIKRNTRHTFKPFPAILMWFELRPKGVLSQKVLGPGFFNPTQKQEQDCEKRSE